MKLKDGIVRPDLSLAEKVEYFPPTDTREDGGSFLKFFFPEMIVFVKLPESGFETIKY